VVTILTGRATPESGPIPLRAGRVTALLDGPDLRHVAIGGTELVQRVYVAVRDAPWNTIPAVYDEWDIRSGSESFEVRFRAVHRHDDIHFAWRGSIDGTADGVIRYEMDGVCHGVFQYSKIGFNVHHDLPGSVGRPYRARAGDREWTGVLPRAIDPQRIVDGTLSGMFEPYEELAIEVVDGLEAVVRLEGDVLELQDHRNWTDANFKSYATPLALGFPFDSTDGARIHQVLTVTSRGEAPAVVGSTPVVRVGAPTGRHMPAIGLGMASHGDALTDHERAVLRALAPDHLRVDLRMEHGAWEGPFEQALAEARALDASLELAVAANAASTDALAGLAERLAAADVAIARVLVYPLAEGFSAFVTTTPPDIIALVRRALEASVGDVVFAGGTNQNFSDINRDRPTDPRMDGLCFSISPTVHAADDASIIENLTAQSVVVAFAREIAGPRSIHVSPVTIATRFGPYPAGPAQPGDLPPAVDVRQLSLLGAAWTAGSIGECARGGADSVTYYETTGWQGVMERDAGSPMPKRFPSTPGHAFPLFHVLADAIEVGAAPVLDVEASAPLRVTAFAMEVDGGQVVVVANLLAEAQDVSVTGLAGEAVMVRSLDAGTAATASADPVAFRTAPGTQLRADARTLSIHLEPYAVVRLSVPGA
jgi:hypothetical protein